MADSYQRGDRIRMTTVDSYSGIEREYFGTVAEDHGGGELFVTLDTGRKIPWADDGQNTKKIS